METKLSVVELELNPDSGVPLNIALVQGPEGAALIDTAKDYHFGQIVTFLRKQHVRKGDLRLILNTHYHGDHIGANLELVQRYGCLVAASIPDAPAIESADIALRLVSMPPAPDDPPAPAAASRPTSPVHVRFSAPFTVSLGGDALIEAIALPGHTDGSCGFYERSTASLVLGDAVLMMDTPGFTGFHILQNGAQYRQSLVDLRRFAGEHPIHLALTAHHPPMSRDQFLDLLDRSIAFSDSVAALAHQAQQHGDLTYVAHALCREMGKTYNPAARVVARAYTAPPAP